MQGRTVKYVSVVVNVIASVFVGILTNEKMWWQLCLPVATMLVWNIYAFVRLPRARLELVLRIVYDYMEAAPEDEVRCAFLRPVRPRFRKAIVKVTSYQNGKFDHTRRVIREGIGTAGRAFSTRKEVVLPDVQGEFQDVMTRDWGFTQAEAQKLRQDRKSYMSVPFLNDRLVHIHWSTSYFRAILEKTTE